MERNSFDAAGRKLGPSRWKLLFQVTLRNCADWVIPDPTGCSNCPFLLIRGVLDALGLRSFVHLTLRAKALVPLG
jgi:hypothetical protein